MVQFKLSALFILAAAVVAPTVALPVPTDGGGTVQGATSQPAQSAQQSAQSAPISQQFAQSPQSSPQSSQQSAQSTQSTQSIGKS